MGVKLVSLKMPDFFSALQKQLPNIQSAIQSDITKNFDTTSSPERISWAKRRRYYSHPILNKTGSMKRNISIHSKAVSKYEIDLYELSNIGYGSYHQYGTNRMVARPFLGVSEEAKREVIKYLQSL